MIENLLPDWKVLDGHLLSLVSRHLIVIYFVVFQIIE